MTADLPDSRPGGIARLRAAMSGPELGPDCWRCREGLEAYVASQIRGEPYAELHPDVARHLDTCPHCAEAYALLYEVELADHEGRLPEHVPDRAPDLEFLRTRPAGASAPAAGPVARLRTALGRVSGHMRLELSPSLLVALVPAQASVRSSGSDRYREPLAVLEPDLAASEGSPVSFAAFRDSLQPELCLVEVEVVPPDRALPLSNGIEVSLRYGGLQRQGLTDLWGTVAFEGVPITSLGSLVIEADLPPAPPA